MGILKQKKKYHIALPFFLSFFAPLCCYVTSYRVSWSPQLSACSFSEGSVYSSKCSKEVEDNYFLHSCLAFLYVFIIFFIYFRRRWLLYFPLILRDRNITFLNWAFGLNFLTYRIASFFKLTKIICNRRLQYPDSKRNEVKLSDSMSLFCAELVSL